MQCQQLHEQLKAGILPQTKEVQLHLSTCQTCRVLAEQEGELAKQLQSIDNTSTQISATLFAELQQTIQAETHGIGAWRSLSTLHKHLWVWGSMALLFLGIWFIRPRVDLGMYPVSRMFVTLLSFGLILGFSLWLLLRPLYRPPLSVPWQLFGWGLVLGFPIIIALLPAAHTGHPNSTGGMGTDFWPAVFKCLGFGSAVSIPIVWLLSILYTNKESNGILVLTTGLACGVFANAILLIHCAIVAPSHLLWGHGLIGFVLFGIWGLFVLLFKSWRSQQQRKA